MLSCSLVICSKGLPSTWLFCPAGRLAYRYFNWRQVQSECFVILQRIGATEVHDSMCCPALQDIWSDLQLFLTFNTVLLVLGAFIKTAVVDRLDLQFGGPQALEDSETATG